MSESLERTAPYRPCNAEGSLLHVRSPTCAVAPGTGRKGGASDAMKASTVAYRGGLKDHAGVPA